MLSLIRKIYDEFLLGSIEGKKFFFKTLILEIISKGLPYLFLPIFLKSMSKEDFATFTFIGFTLISLSNFLFLGAATTTSGLFYKFEKQKNLNWNLFLVIITTHFLFSIFLFSSFGSIVLKNIFGEIVTQNLFSIKFLFIISSLTTGYSVLYSRQTAFTNTYRKFQYWNIVRLLVSNILILCSVYYLEYNLSFYNRFFIESITLGFFALLFGYEYFRNSIILTDKILIKKILNLGYPLVLSYVAVLVYTVSDKYLIQEHYDKSVLASYNLAFLLIYPIGLLFTTFFDTYWSPKFFRENSLFVNYKNTIAIIPKYTLVLLLILPFYLICIILYLSVTDNYLEYSNVVWIVGVLYIVRALGFISQFMNNFFIFKENTIITSAINGLLTVFVVFANIIFIPNYSIPAALIILLVAEVLRIIFFFYFIRKKYITIA